MQIGYNGALDVSRGGWSLLVDVGSGGVRDIDISGSIYRDRVRLGRAEGCPALGIYALYERFFHHAGCLGNIQIAAAIHCNSLGDGQSTGYGAARVTAGGRRLFKHQAVAVAVVA